MCVRPKIEFANVRACEAKNRRNSQFGITVGIIAGITTGITIGITVGITIGITEL